MTFLNPAYLFGLFAAAIPIIIHFLNLRKHRVIEFSTLKFLKEIQRTKIRNLKIKQWLLLLIRVLIIIFLVLAFSRPTLTNVSLPIGDNSAKTSAVIIIDNSISLSIKDAKGSSFAELKEFAFNILKHFNNGDEVAVLTSSLEDKNDFHFIKNINFIRDKLERLKISPISIDIKDAFDKALNLLSTSENANKEIFILSDFQKSKFFSDKLISEKKTNAKIKIFLIPFNKSFNNNISITNFRLDNQIIEKNGIVSYNSEIQNGENYFSNGVLSLFINRERVAQESFSLQKKETRTLFIANSVNKFGLIENKIEVDDDNLIMDNSRFFSVFINEKINILGVSNNSESLKYLKLVFENSGQEINFHQSSFDQVPIFDLSSIDLIILLSDFSASSDEIRKVFLNKNLLIFPSSQFDEKKFNSVLSAFDLGKGKFISSDSYVEFDNNDWNHPLLKDLFESKNVSTIESPQIKKYFRIKINPRAQNIIILQDNFPFVFESNTHNQKILVFSVPSDLSGSDFPIKGIFAPLILKSINYLSIKINEDKNYVPGCIVSFSFPKKQTLIKIIKPDGTEEFTKTNNLGFVNFSNTNQIGCYKFYDNEKLIYFADVNIDSEENKYDFYSVSEAREKISKYINESIIYTIENKNKLNDQIIKSRLGEELWKYLIVLVLMLLIVEMFLARNTKQEMSRIT